MLLPMVIQKGITAVPEYGLLRLEVLLHIVGQIVQDVVKMRSTLLTVLGHAFDSLLAQAKQFPMLVVQHLIPDAITGLPLRKISLLHPNPSLYWI